MGRIGGGVGTYVLSYLLVGLVTLPLMPRILQPSRVPPEKRGYCG